MKQSQKELLEHSKAKIKLLNEYINRYISIIGNDGYTKTIKIYDLFCGEGQYENEGEGSPIIMLKSVKELFFINKARKRQLPKFELNFNDLKKKKIEKLKSIVEERKLFYSEFGSISYSSIDYQSMIANLVKELSLFKEEKAFVFIDPYGYTDVRASHIKDLLKSKKSEVLLFLPIQFMYRFDDKGTPPALMEFICDFMDYNLWKSKDIKNVWQYVEELKVEFRKYYGKGIYVDTFTIRKDPQTVFCLFFFSSHIRGFEKMLESKWSLDDQEGRGWEYNQSRNLFTDIKTNPLEHKIEEFLKQKNVYNGEIYEFCLENGFLPKHANEIFKNWQKNGRLTVANASQKNAFYTSYENWKKDPRKVHYKLI